MIAEKLLSEQRLTVPEAAKEFGISRRKLIAWIVSGKLEGVHGFSGTGIVTSREAVLRMLKQFERPVVEVEVA